MNKSYSVRVGKAYKEYRRSIRFIEACAAVALLIVVLLVQSTFGIDSLLTAVAGALAGAIVVYFGGRALGKSEGQG